MREQVPGKSRTSVIMNDGVHRTAPPPGQRSGLAKSVERMLDNLGLHTVCQEGRCPNVAECLGENTATFMILGDVCARGCRLCAVKRGCPSPPDPTEPARVAQAAARLGLSYVVITSVSRDDLPDGGASHYAETMRAVHHRLPEAGVEVLIPDLDGSRAALETILSAKPDVVNHVIETVPGLYPRLRPRADYRRSLEVLVQAKAAAPGVVTKSGLMLGLGERTQEVLQVLCDLRQARCDLLTLGQYLQPTDRQVAVDRYISRDEFAWYEERARELGFRGIAASPLVRSSYRAQALWQQWRDFG